MKLNINYSRLPIFLKESTWFSNYYYILPYIQKENIKKINTKPTIKITKIKKYVYFNRNYLIRIKFKNLIDKFFSMMFRGKSFLKKKLINIYLYYFENIYNVIFLKNYLIEKSIQFFFGTTVDFLKLKFKNIDMKDHKGLLYNINFFIDLAINLLNLGVSFSYITNVIKSKRKIKNIILKPRYIFGYTRVKISLKNLSEQILKTHKTKSLIKSLNTDSEAINIKESISLQSRINWSLTSLLFNTKKSIFYKRKWNIFLNFYKQKAPMYF